MKRTLSIWSLMLLATSGVQAQEDFREILFVERDQYAVDHHNTETLFQLGEINDEKFRGGSALRALDIATGQVRTLLASEQGVIRDPELSFDGRKIIFSMRPQREGWYHIYEIGTDGSGLRQLTSAAGVSDIDPLYLPDGGIVFTSTREPKYCMCNRHIMGNLYRMEADGANIVQIGGSTLFEGHSSLLGDGRILYDRWEYVDRNFGDAQGLWTVNPDGTKHAIYYGNNTASPGGVIDARQVPGSDLVACIFGSCHDRPWGALALIDRKKGVDGAEPVVEIWPAEARGLIGKGNYDQFMKIPVRYEDPCPLDENTLLVSRSVRWDTTLNDYKMALYRIDRQTGTETLLYEGEKGIFDPMPIAPRRKPSAIPFARDFSEKPGMFYVQDVYEGTNMTGVERGAVKWLRVVESPEKRTWTEQAWQGQGEHAPAMNWSSFELKQILGEVPVAEDGSACFEVPAGKFVYFQLLDKDKKMIQSMRSGTMAMAGEVNGCIGCHEDRLSIPVPSGKMPLALQRGPAELTGWMGREPRPFSYTREVQPIFDRHCLKCHDFDASDREKLVLAGDRNPFFNASYINLYVGKKVTLIGAGPAAIQDPYSWGSHASVLTKIIDGGHHGVELSGEERQTLYAWMDVNGVYYPAYESAYGENMAGRSPLTFAETDSLSALTGIDFRSLNSYWRGMQAQVAFERPELSPCLDVVRDDPAKYERAVAIIAEGGRRLKGRPRADMEGFVPSERHREMLRKYAAQLEEEIANRRAVETGGKRYDR
ncbi:hypothetical protein [Rikenella microfusus]|uniref:Translocation protein TolB n=1 Tax=Rikenella microfusus TaxID=28139 RepID=A0A379MUS2_9BACT|nr:hypothetical protein [Rikenella microfusus]SUE34607.1 translocation protein TolB [Rikenella microfusus]